MHKLDMITFSVGRRVVTRGSLQTATAGSCCLMQIRGSLRTATGNDTGKLKYLAFMTGRPCPKRHLRHTSCKKAWISWLQGLRG